MRKLLRTGLGPFARLFLRLRLKSWRLDDVEVLVVGAHKLGHLALEPLVSSIESEVCPSDTGSPGRQGLRRNHLWNLGRSGAASNRELWKVWKREVPTAPSWLLAAAATKSRIKVRPAPFYSRCNALDRSPRRLTLPRDVRHMTERFLADAGIGDGRPFVGLVINEGTHYGATWSKYESDIDRSLRLLTFDPDDFCTTIHSLIARGYGVVRLGRHSERKIDVSHPLFIDYAHHERRCDVLDIGLAALASHVVSTQTGPDAVALAFGKPVTYVDVARLRYSFFDVGSVHWQPATLIDGNGNKLSLHRQISEGIAALKTPDDFARAGVRVARSGPENYATTAIEGIESSSGRLVMNSTDTDLQRRAREIIAVGVRNGTFPLRGNPTALISPSFLRSNPWWCAEDGR